LSGEAERTLRNGVPLMKRYLPFFYANLMERMWLVLGIIVGVLLPLSRIVPPLYEFRIRSRVFRWCGQLCDIEERAKSGDFNRDDLRLELQQLQNRVEKIAVPLSYTDELYALRHHIDLVSVICSRHEVHAVMKGGTGDRIQGVIQYMLA
jgi:hypothetical protein